LLEEVLQAEVSMKAALYARYSTLGQSEASIEDQLRECREFAKRQGFDVIDEFHDAAMSGNESNRPGYQRMLAMAREKRFGVIVAHELSRLSRNEAETHSLREELEWLGVHIVTATDGIDTRQASMGILLSVKSAMARAELKQAADRTHRGLKGRVLAGRSGGGKCYGYGSKEGVRYVIEEQARNVVWIFERFRDGASSRAIANELNARGVPSPGAEWNRTQRRGDGRWMQSAIYNMLRNRIYVGEVVWNRRQSRKKVRSGKRGFAPRPKDEWIISRDESLRIVSDELWNQVHARIAQRTREMGEAVKRGMSKHQALAVGKGRAPKYLLSTLLVCESCGSKLVIAGAKGASYACSGWLNGGESACSNRVRVSREKVEARVLEGVRRDLLSDEAIAEYRKALRSAIRDRRRAADQGRQAAERRRKELEAQVQRLVDGIASRALPADGAVGARLRAAEEELAAMAVISRAPTEAQEEASTGALVRYREMVSDLTTATGARIGEVRDALRELLGQVRVGLDLSGRPVARFGLQVSDGSGGRI
jgi:site-specific DNA recombinase